jgi:acetolactate synthase small subunit
MFLITANLQSRTHARVLQTLDHNMIPIHSFLVSTDAEWVTIHALVELEPEKVNRVQELLSKIPSVYRVERLAPAESACRTVALFHISCDMLTRLPVLQTAAALGLKVVCVDSYSVVIEATGSFSEITNLEAIFCQHGVLKTVARATLGVAQSLRPTADGCFAVNEKSVPAPDRACAAP